MRKKRLYLVRLCTVLCICLYAAAGFAQTHDYYRKTALRHIETAKRLLSEHNYDASYTQAELGLSYDNTVADLYYIQALCLSVKGSPPYAVIPAVQAALNALWYDYNRDAARLLLADLYLKTGKSVQALELLDETPALYSRDALYSRAKALYICGRSEEARSVVKRAALQYSEDERFALLFFDAEHSFYTQKDFLYNFFKDTGRRRNGDALFAELTALFLPRLGVLEKNNTDVLLKASVFARTAEDTKRLLKAWNAYGNTHPLYGIYALKFGLLSEEAALDYMQPFFNTAINYGYFADFIGLITEKSVKERLRRLFAAYEGTLVFDTNKDGIGDIISHYRFGRPSLIEYDGDQDGKKEWAAECDYGTPVNLKLFAEDTLMWYGVWPAVERVVRGGLSSSLSAEKNKAFCTYDLIDNAFFWTPFVILREPLAGTVLHIPALHERPQNFPSEELFELSHTVERPVDEYAGSRVRLNLLHGHIQYALYTDNGTPYAYGYFENGILKFRNVDRDKNGTYEITEFYAVRDGQSAEERNEQAEADLSRRLFGRSDMARGLYMQKAVFDNGAAAVYTETYGTDGSFSFSQKTAESGGWNVHYVRESGTAERIEYDHPFSGQKLTVILENGIPVFANGRKVIKDPAVPFFWFGEYPGNFYGEMMIRKLKRQKGQDLTFTISDLLWVKEKDRFIRIFAVKNGDTYFGEVLYE